MTMSNSHTVTTSFPLGLFCNATWSGPLASDFKQVLRPSSAEDCAFVSTLGEVDAEPHLTLAYDGLGEDVYWDDETI